jgi:hypothetical protein
MNQTTDAKVRAAAERGARARYVTEMSSKMDHTPTTEDDQTTDFGDALRAMKAGATATRVAWRPNKRVGMRTPDSGSTTLSYLELTYDDGRRSPWTPTRCDLLETDWIITP